MRFEKWTALGNDYLIVEAASLPWEPTKWNSVPHHFLWVYGRSAVTGEEKLVQREIFITPN